MDAQQWVNGLVKRMAECRHGIDYDPAMKLWPEDGWTPFAVSGVSHAYGHAGWSFTGEVLLTDFSTIVVRGEVSATYADGEVYDTFLVYRTWMAD